MKIGIDLLWVRIGVCGGTESYIRNLLIGFAKYDEKNEYLLFAARDNAESFRQYARMNRNIHVAICPVDSMSRVKRIVWENFYLDKAAVKAGCDVMFVPVYSMPRRKKYGKYNNVNHYMRYITVVHDLQLLHYPEYFSNMRSCFILYCWAHTARKSDTVVLTSRYSETDFLEHYPISKGRTCVINIPIISTASGLSPKTVEKYGVKPGEYFYCVSSLLKHKNLETLLRMMAYRKSQVGDKKEEKLIHKDADGDVSYYEKLVVSGVGGANGEDVEFSMLIHELGIEENVIVTGYVSNEERDCLYENCRLFLFPSVFEGFGMPPIEAMRKGKRVVMTRLSCLEEITQGKADYVDNPYDEKAWSNKVDEVSMDIERMNENPETEEPKGEMFPEYSLEKITDNFTVLFEHIR